MKTILLSRIDGNFLLFVEVVAWLMNLIVEVIPFLLIALELASFEWIYHQCHCENGLIGQSCDSCTNSAQCIHSLQLNQTCWRDPSEVLIGLPQKVIDTANTTRTLTCESDAIGLLTTYLGDHHIEITRPVEDIIEITVFSTYSELHPSILECHYENCQVTVRTLSHQQKLSSLDCSIYVPTLNPCLYCSSFSCVYPPDHPFGDLFRYVETPMIFACDEEECVWRHHHLFTQQLHCQTGVCITDISPSERQYKVVTRNFQ